MGNLETCCQPSTDQTYLEDPEVINQNQDDRLRPHAETEEIKRPEDFDKFFRRYYIKGEK